MSRRTKLLEQLLQTDTFGDEAKDQQDKLRIVSELILCDMVDIALNGVQVHGAGSLFINLIDGNRESVYMSGHDIEEDLRKAESFEDEETVKMLRQVLERVDENDWEIGPDDEPLRLWTASSLQLAARVAGYSVPLVPADSSVRVLRPELD